MKLLSPNKLIASLAFVGLVGAAGIVHNPHGGYDAPKSNNLSLFPTLTSLRDRVIEFIFGQHPTKESLLPVFDDLRAQYGNEIVLRFTISNGEEELALSEAASRLFLDIWAFTNEYVDIRLHTDEVPGLLSLLPRPLQLAHSTLINDLAAAVYQTLPSGDASDVRISSEGMYADLSPSRRAGDNIFFQNYQPTPVIVRWMRLLEAMFPSYVEYLTIGQSWEGRDIPALRVGVPAASTPTTPRKTIVITGGLHGREWISTSTVNYLAWSFITTFGKEPMITKLLDEFDFVFVPVLNPDGVEYTWRVDRLWRKSRQQTNLRYCRGLDLDHAFGFGWDEASTQSDPCSESYGGEEPFQAVEARQLANWARNETLHNVQFVGLIDLHSYSQQILFPFSYSCDVDPPNLENLTELAAGIAKAIRLSSGEPYSVASACEDMVKTGTEEEGMEGVEHEARVKRQRIEAGGGSAIDWFYHEMRAHFSYQIKLRDTGSYGFLLPKEYIIPTGEEVFHAMKYLGDYLLGNNGIERVKNRADEATVSDATASDTTTREEMRGSELRRRKLGR